MREYDSQMASLNERYTYVLLRANHLNKYTTPRAISPVKLFAIQHII